MAEWADLIRALGDLLGAILWPAVASTFLFLFRDQIRNLLDRLLKMKIFGQEVELERKLDKLQFSVEAASTGSIIEPDATSESPTPTPDQRHAEKDDQRLEVPMATSRHFASRRRERAIQRILDAAAKSPKVALIELANEIERELRLHISPDYLLREIPRWPLPVMSSLQILAKQGRIPDSVLASAEQFWDVRNSIVHYRGDGEIKDDDILRAIDSGITLLRTLYAIPRETHIVDHPGVDLYVDDKGEIKRDGVRGIVLDSFSEAGIRTSRRVFPTPRNDYEKGDELTWEWNPKRSESVEASWYRDPETGDLKYAFGGSLAFVGRKVDDPTESEP